MKAEIVKLEIKQRLNKLDSNDYDNLMCWEIRDAYNKAQLEFTRRNLHGGNQYREGAEQSTTRVDDFQTLITSINMSGQNNVLYYETEDLPSNFLRHSRISATAGNDCCPQKRITVTLKEDSNVDVLLEDDTINPNFKWSSTFATYSGDKVRVYTDDKFVIQSVELSYYRKPREISFDNCEDINGNLRGNVDPELKDDLVHLIINEAADILARDLENYDRAQSLGQKTEQNN